MHQFFIQVAHDFSKPLQLTRKDYQHLFVLRLNPHEQFILSDGEGMDYLCEVQTVSKDCIEAICLDKQANNRELSTHLTLLQGLPKKDKLELIVQKAVELGAYRIVPVTMQRSIVKLEEKRAQKKTDRLTEISRSAATQAKRGIIPEVSSPMTFKEALTAVKDADLKILAFENEDSQRSLATLLPRIQSANHIAILVGPEGGISEEEWQLAHEAGFESISLGRRILRTETAGLAMLSFLMLHLDQ